MRILGGYQNTKNNGEDFALTPFLFGVYVNGATVKVFGLGLCWGWYSGYLGLGFNVPKGYPSFKKFPKT